MRQYERNGVVVDQCTECRGLFLDRGELERLIDAESSYYARTAAQPAPAAHMPQGTRWRDYDSDEYPKYGHGRPKRRGSFLSELFD
jgi:Zn-finger nucleic acid-binding protein